MTKYIAMIAAALFISGCTPKMKQKLGIITPGPNEYAVEKNKSLEIPPHYDLPAPGSIKEE